jgi:transcriptional regulator with XRE-family HTH domain
LHFETERKKYFLQLSVDTVKKAGYISSYMMTLAEKLRKLRNGKKMSMSQVARLSELAEDRRGRITQGYISRLESGKETNPSLMKLITLCSIYKIKPNELFVKNSLKKFQKNR